MTYVPLLCVVSCGVARASLASWWLSGEVSEVRVLMSRLTVEPPAFLIACEVCVRVCACVCVCVCVFVCARVCVCISMVFTYKIQCEGRLTFFASFSQFSVSRITTNVEAYGDPVKHQTLSNTHTESHTRAHTPQGKYAYPNTHAGTHTPTLSHITPMTFVPVICCRWPDQSTSPELSSQ